MFLTTIVVTFSALSTSTSPVASGKTTAKLSGLIPLLSSHDRYESHDPLTTPTEYQRQQQRFPPQTPPPHTPTPSSQHRLRRTPRFSSTPSPNPRLEKQPTQQPHERVVVSLGPQGRYVLSGIEPHNFPSPKEARRPGHRLSQELVDSADESSTHSPQQQRQATNLSGTAQPELYPVARITKNTRRAILYALEEGLRGPNEYTDDYAELYSPMADIPGGLPATSNGKAASMSRPIAARAPAPTGSPGIKGPRAIMQERAAREAAREKQREERERMEREHAEAEARAQDEAIRRETERRAAAAAAAAGAGHVYSGTGADVPSTARRPVQTSTGRARADDGNRGGAYPTAPGDSQAQGTQRHTRATSAPSQPVPGATTSGAAGNQPQAGEASGSASRARSSFPHAFERWENLSAHWEGLTNFWIRRLQQNAQEIGEDPVSQQLARQVTDLSSAGANLFHAVVELQRLRASSERKFQRWFFETRSELERNQEVTAMLEAALEEERRTRADAIREALATEQGSSKLQQQLAEARKELVISKEEARRAWDELGRRENEERERTTSLQMGHPTIVGGVQVVPMTQGMGRSDSTQRDPRSYGQAAPAEYAHQSPSSRSARPEYTQAPAVQPTATSASGSAAYQAQPSVHHQQSYPSEGGYSEGEY